jgi:hypothetical protein
MPPRSKRENDELERKRSEYRRDMMRMVLAAVLWPGLAASALALTRSSFLLGGLLVLTLFAYFFVLPTFSAALTTTWKKDPPSERELLASAGLAVIRGPARRSRPTSRLATFLCSGGFRQKAPDGSQDRTTEHDRSWRD